MSLLPHPHRVQYGVWSMEYLGWTPDEHHPVMRDFSPFSLHNRRGGMHHTAPPNKCRTV